MKLTILTTTFAALAHAKTATKVIMNDDFAAFLQQHNNERDLSEEVLNTEDATNNIASTDFYPKMKHRFCEYINEDETQCETEAELEAENGEQRRLNPQMMFLPPGMEMPPGMAMPPGMLPPTEPEDAQHDGSAESFSFPCFPWKEDDGWTMIAGNDDMSFEIVLPFDFKLYGTTYPAGSTIWINNNGNLSFDNAISSFTTSGFPVNTPMIAPFWSDVDTRSHGNAWYKFMDDNKLAVIWDEVGYYPERGDKRNTFQVVISDGTDEEVGINTNVCFCYVDMDWTTGGASSGTDGLGALGATVGVNRGIEDDYIQVGRFNANGTHYDGPGGDFDGVDYLDFKGSTVLVHGVVEEKKGLCFEAMGINIPPIASDFPMNNQVTIPCDSKLELTVVFTSPELQQDITVVPSGIPAGMTIVPEVSAEGDIIKLHIEWEPDFSSQSGSHEISFFAEDDYEVPANITEVLTVIVASCGGNGGDLPDKCVPIEDDMCLDAPGPYCTPFRSPEHCYADESFPMLIVNRRHQAFENPEMVEFEGFWFHHLEDKVAQKAFTASTGFPSPDLYCCVSDVNDLESVCFAPGNTIPFGFTVRATGGHSGKGIYVLPYGFGGVDLISGETKTLADIVFELGNAAVDNILVEEFISGSAFGEIPTLPTEYKFHMFDGMIGAIDVIYNRGTPCSCYAVVDEDFDRLDQHGCFFPQPAFGLDAEDDGCFDIDFEYGANHPFKFKGQDLCGELQEPSPCVLDSMKEIATELSEVIGVYMRIDMFVGADGTVVVQEYTSNHAGGLRHCAAKETEDGCIDSCFLGKLWKEKSDDTMYGGPQTSLPPVLDSWWTKTDSDKCTAANDATSATTYTPPASCNP